jgi:hypothetical protein
MQPIELFVHEIVMCYLFASMMMFGEAIAGVRFCKRRR